jgi:hypothetical protein
VTAGVNRDALAERIELVVEIATAGGLEKETWEPLAIRLFGMRDRHSGTPLYLSRIAGR